MHWQPPATCPLTMAFLSPSTMGGPMPSLTPTRQSTPSLQAFPMSTQPTQALARHYDMPLVHHCFVDDTIAMYWAIVYRLEVGVNPAMVDNHLITSDHAKRLSHSLVAPPSQLAHTRRWSLTITSERAKQKHPTSTVTIDHERMPDNDMAIHH